MRICSHLEIEEGLHSCMHYLAQHMPAERIYLERYEPELSSMRVVACATEEGGELMDVLVPVTQAANAALGTLAEAWRAGELPSVFVVNRPADEPVTRSMLSALDLPISSAMSLPLISQGKVLGALALLAEGDDRYTDEHARLYALLKDPFFIAMSNTLKHREILKLKELLADDNRYLHGELRRISGEEIIGANFGLRDVMMKVRQVSTLNSPVLLSGETGVGKDVIANAIHYSSSRNEGPFIGVNCGAIPDTLIDSELFGHEKGAFTGALSQKRGRFERANHGTIFLDEIGELPLAAQSRLLRVLQHREIERVGGSSTIKLDIRIIAATNRDLQEMVRAREFREDLWYRLNVFPIEIPPLRDRRSDIPELVHHFLKQKSRELKLSAVPPLAPGAMEKLNAYHWPGNIRELQNLVERALILYPAGPITFDQLPAEALTQTIPAPIAQPGTVTDLDTVVSGHIQHILQRTKGKIHGPGGAAELLGINPSTLRNRMKKLGIPYGRQQIH